MDPVAKLFHEALVGYHTQNSGRAFMPSATGALGVPEVWSDTLGGWSPSPGQGYCQTARKRFEIMQRTVAESIRSNKGGADFLDEAEKRALLGLPERRG